VVCATVAFGMGLDLPDIGLVVHWNAAHSFLDDAVTSTGTQETGKARKEIQTPI
jgi:superfamily II DNA helicase RecQ